MGKSIEQTPAIAIETTSLMGSVALCKADRILDVRRFSEQRRHAVELLPCIADLCNSHDVAPDSVGMVYVSAGPGSFTGVRIGITVARTLAWSIGARVVCVPTLDVIAWNTLTLADPPRQLVAMLDAKRGHVFAASFVLEGCAYRRVDTPAERDITEYAATLDGPHAAIGEGVAYHRAAVEQAGLRILPDDIHPASAGNVHRIGYLRAQREDFDDPDQIVPIYVRRPEAEEVWERRHSGGAESVHGEGGAV